MAPTITIPLLQKLKSKKEPVKEPVENIETPSNVGQTPTASLPIKSLPKPPPTAVGSSQGGGVILRDPLTGETFTFEGSVSDEPKDPARASFVISGGGSSRAENQPVPKT